MMHEQITDRILKCAFQVHSALGAGLLESAYSACLHYQFSIEGLRFEYQLKLPVSYQEVQLDAGYRIDFLVENCVIVELKAVDRLLPLHTAQILSYLKLSGRPVGLILNFNVPHLRQGIRRVVNGYVDHQVRDLTSVSSVVESDPLGEDSGH